MGSAGSVDRVNNPKKTMKTTHWKTTIALLVIPSMPLASAEEKTTETSKPAAKEVSNIEPGSISAALRDSKTFNIFVKALKAADLDVMLGSKGSYTVFAPTDEAFGKLPKGALDQLLLPSNKEKLRSLLMYHILNGNFLASELKDGQQQTANAEKIEIDVHGDTIKLEDKTKIAKADLVVSNGVIHSIDRVLVPKSLDGFAGLDTD